MTGTVTFTIPAQHRDHNQVFIEHLNFATPKFRELKVWTFSWHSTTVNLGAQNNTLLW